MQTPPRKGTCRCFEDLLMSEAFPLISILWHLREGSRPFPFPTRTRKKKKTKLPGKKDLKGSEYLLRNYSCVVRNPFFFFLSSLLFPVSQKVERKLRSPWGSGSERAGCPGLKGWVCIPCCPSRAVPPRTPFSPSPRFISVLELTHCFTESSRR